MTETLVVLRNALFCHKNVVRVTEHYNYNLKTPRVNQIVSKLINAIETRQGSDYAQNVSKLSEMLNTDQKP